MKRTLMILAAAVIFLNTLVVPVTVKADAPTNTNCNGGVCKP